MKLEEVNSKATVNEGVVLHKIGLDPSKIGFIQEIMRNKIYTYPVLACVREVLTNALDASKKVGKDASSITVHLPTKSEPYFSVKDEGIGMSKEVFLKYFAEYGNSLASDSNELTGCYGLGSKAPFTITDTFKVSTCWEGEKYNYVCFITNEGNNAVILSSQLKSSSLGTEILIEDIDIYITDIVAAYYNMVYLWEVKPKCNVEIAPKQVLVSGDGWEVLSNNKEINKLKFNTICNSDEGYKSLEFSSKLSNSKIIFLMGGVSYTLRQEDLTKVSNHIEGSNIESSINAITQNYGWESNLQLKTIVFNCEIGSISISPQREYIDVDKSIDFIAGKFKDLIKGMHDSYLERIEKCKDLIEACNLDYTLRHFRPNSVYFLGVKIPEVGNVYINKKFELYCTGIEQTLRSKRDVIRRYKVGFIRIDNYLNIIVDNVNPKGSNIRNIGKLLRAYNFDKCYIVSTGILSKEDIISTEDFLNPELYPKERIIFLSDIQKPEKKKRESTKVKVSILLDKEEYDFKKSLDFKDKSENLKDPKVYFNMSRRVSEYGNSYYDLGLEDLKEIKKVFNTTIFGVSNNNINLVNDAGWCYWRTKYKDLIEENNKKIVEAFNRLINYCASNSLPDISHTIKYLGRLDTTYFKSTLILPKEIINVPILEGKWELLKVIADKDKSIANSQEYIALKGFVNLVEEIRSEFRSNPISLFPDIYRIDKEESQSIGWSLRAEINKIGSNNIRARIILATEVEEEIKFLLEKLFKESDE